MQTIFDSPNFVVVEFADFGIAGQHPAGGYEIVDKTLRREIFLGGKDAEQFRREVAKLIAGASSAEDVDDFLGGYAGLMNTSVALH